MADPTLDDYTISEDTEQREISLEGLDSERKRELEGLIQKHAQAYLKISDTDGILHLAGLAKQNNYELTFNDFKHVLLMPQSRLVTVLGDLEQAEKITKSKEGKFVTYVLK